MNAVSQEDTSTLSLYRLTVEFAVDLESDLKWGKANVPCL
jgi:hypothetical protein